MSVVPLPVAGPSSDVVDRKGDDQTPTARDAGGTSLGVPGRILSLPELWARDAADAVEDEEQRAYDGFLRVSLDVRRH